MNQPPVDPLAQPLAPREQDVLEGLGAGLTNRQIAERLSFALSTVKWYTRQIYNKLGVSNRQEATARARALGMLPTAAANGVVAHNLTAAATPFVGREQELATLTLLLADPTVRLITIVGPGGIGKTRLALESASQQLMSPGAVGDGIFFVSLAPVANSQGIVVALAGILGLQFHGNHSETEQLLNFLIPKKLLLVLDNFEHLLEARPLLREIARRAANVTLLITSRERLQLQREQLFPLQGLAFKQGSEANARPAVQLFLNFVRRTVPDFQLLTGDTAALNRICHLVEGMPLGLELAAAWAGLLPLAEIAAGIERSLDLLTSAHYDVPPRHYSMRAALDASWRRLIPQHQHAFQGLSVFAGGFTRAAAQTVAGATLPQLAALADKSWLTYDRPADRYHIHELLRQFGAEKLATNKVHDRVVREKYCAYYSSFLQAHESAWHTALEPNAIREIQSEVDNIKRAWRWAANNDDATALLAPGIESLCRFYEVQGQFREGRYACNLADKSLQQQPVWTPELYAFRARVLGWAARFELSASQQDILIEQSQESLQQAIEQGRDAQAEQAFFHFSKAKINVKADFSLAIKHLNMALALFQELDQRSGEIEALTILGGIYMNQGQLEMAAKMNRAALELCQQSGFESGAAELNAKNSQLARYRGDFAESEAGLRKSIRVARQLGHRLNEIAYLCTLSYTLSWAGKYQQAQDLALEALELEKSIYQLMSPHQLNAHVKASFHLGLYAEAREMGHDTLAMAQQQGYLDNAGWAALFLGNIALAQGNLDESEARLCASINYLADLNHSYRYIPQAILSYVWRAQGKPQQASQALLEPLQTGIKQRSVSPLMKVLPAAALLAVDKGQIEWALELYGGAQQFAHVTNSRWFADVACRELDEVIDSVPPTEAVEALAKGGEQNVWKTAEKLLFELTS